MALLVFNKPAPLGIGGSPAPVSLESFRPETCKDAPASISFRLNSASPDAEQIIEHLATFALAYGKNPCIVAFARRLVADITTNNAVEAQYSRVASFVLDNGVYQADPRGAEYVRSPIQMLREYCRAGYTRGDCDDLTLLAASLLNAVGVAVQIVAVKLPGSEVYNHVLLRANIRGEWRWFDPCNKDTPTKEWTGYILRQL